MALDLLSPYVDESRRIERAVQLIEDSLDLSLWVDDQHLDPKDGHKVFSFERQAVVELMHLIDRPGDISASSPSEKHGWRVLGGMMGPVQ